MAIARHSDGNHSLSSWGSKANKCNPSPCRWCVCVCAHPPLSTCIFVHVCYIHTHLIGCVMTSQRNSWPGVGLAPAGLPTPHHPKRSGGGGVRITVELHVQLQPLVPTKPPPPNPPYTPAQDVLSVIVSTSPSGHITDIWTAAGSPQVGESERQKVSKRGEDDQRTAPVREEEGWTVVNSSFVSSY